MVTKYDKTDPPALLAGAEPASEALEASAPGPLRVAIVGLPNTGKSLLFQRLSRRFANSANYPYTTTEIERGRARLGGREVELIDTPGITGLELCSEDEAPTRELLQGEAPDLLIQCADASNLARSLVLTAQFADLQIPMVLCLTMADEALSRGRVVDVVALADELGIPVHAVCPLDGRGVQGVDGLLRQARAPRPVRYPRWVESRLEALEGEAAQRLQRLVRGTPSGLTPGQSIWHAVLEAHSHWANAIGERVVRSTGLEPRRTAWDALAALALHPLGAWVLLLLVVLGVYLLVAYVGVGLLAGAMDRHVAGPVIAQIGAWTGPGLLHEVLVGQYGLLSLGLFNAVCTVLPILGVYYLVTALLEESGYFPLLSVQLDRLLRLVGLTGRAVLPVTLGFGCNSMATLATRCLPTDRQRFIACFLIALGIPCAVQLGVMVAILSTVPVAVLLGILGVVLALQIAVGSTLAALLPRCERGEFLVELPRLRPPSLGNVLSRTAHRLVEFFREACPLFIASAAVLLVLHFSGLLERIRDLLAPVIVRGLGLPRDAADLLLMTLARREVGAVMLKDMVDAGRLDLRQIFVSLLVMTLFVPCMSNTLILGRVVGWRRTLIIFVSVTLLALGAGTAAHLLWP